MSVNALVQEPMQKESIDIQDSPIWFCIGLSAHAISAFCLDPLQIFTGLQVNYRKMMVDVTRKTYYSLVAHQQIVGFSCYSYMKFQVGTVICYCYYHQTTRVQSGQCRMPLFLQAKYLQCTL